MSIKNSAEIAAKKQRRASLKKYEDAITRGGRAFLEMGVALGMIRKDELFREHGYETFEAYVEERFDVARAHAYRLINAARVVSILSPNGDTDGPGSKIKTEAVARQLVPLGRDREKMLAVLTAAEARTGKVTAAVVAQVRSELYPEAPVIEGEVVDEAPGLGPADRLAIEAPEPIAPVHVHCQFTRGSMPDCVVVGSDIFNVTAERVTCLDCKTWLATRDGWNWRFGASKAYPGDPECERCGKELDEGVVAAAQLRCVTCDPDRLHYAVEVGGTCEPCAALDLETVALVHEMGAAEDSAAAPSEAASAPADQPQVPDVPEGPPVVAVDQPGIDHPLPPVGEAPAHASVPAAGVPPLPGSGLDNAGGDAVEGEAGPSSSTDPEAIADRFEAFHQWLDTVEFDVVGPLVTDAVMKRIEAAAPDIAAFPTLLGRWRPKAHATP